MLLQLVFAPTTAPRPYNWAVFAQDMYGTFYYPETSGISYSFRMLSAKYGFIYEYLTNTGELSRVLFFKLPEDPHNTTAMPIPLGTLCLYTAWFKYHNIFGIYTASGDNLNQDASAALNDAKENMEFLAAKYGETAVHLLREIVKIMPETVVELPQQPEIIKTEPIKPTSIQLEPGNVEEELQQIMSAKQASLETLKEELSKALVETPESALTNSTQVTNEIVGQSNVPILELGVKKKKKKKKKSSQANSGVLSWIYNHKPNIDIQTAKQLGISTIVAAAGGLVNGAVSDDSFMTPRNVATTALLFMGTFSALRARKEKIADTTVGLATRQVQNTLS